MHVRASIHYDYYRPSKCDLRVYLKAHGEPEEPKTPYEEAIERLGRRHEAEHIATYPEFVDVRQGTSVERIARTKDLLAKHVPVLYHPLLAADTELAGNMCVVVGEPDLLLSSAGGYAVRDVKIARRITEKDHPEILRQIELYGWLLQKTTGVAPVALEVYSGTRDVVALSYDGGVRSLADVQRLASIERAESAPPAAVGWTSCGTCCFHERCWTEAEAARDVALLPGVDRPLALALYDQGVRSYDDLTETFTPGTLAEFKRPSGKVMKRVGDSTSTKIFRAAESLIRNEAILLEKPAIPEAANYVMFDCEGLPPELNELEKVYLWGLQVFGYNNGPYFGITAEFGPEADRVAWEAFLDAAEHVMSVNGNVPFIHWHSYERTKLTTYIDRFGDPNGIGARVRDLLVDLLTITQKSVVLPLPSYSLKVIEKYIGFQRTLPEANGNWSMAAFIEATETNDAKRRADLMDDIRKYNQEDLESTWATLNWLRSFGSTH